MTKKENYEQKTQELILPIITEKQVELYDVEFVKEVNDYYLRIYIDKQSGVTIDDCENVSRAFSDVYDETDFIEEPFILEVSSPGLGRTLKKDKHLEKSIGSKVELKTFKPNNKQKEFSGILKSFDKENIVIENEEGECTFSRSDIAVIKLALEL